MKKRHEAIVWAASLAMAASVSGQAFSEDFSADPAAGWTVNHNPSVDDATDFFFDYGSVGIPPAPNTTDGSTRGMKLQANLLTNAFGGYSVSPTGLSLSGGYTLRFDLWPNYNGPFPVSPVNGAGSTNLTVYGILSSGTVANYPSSIDGVAFATTTDGDSAFDWRAYSSLYPTSYTTLTDNSVYLDPNQSQNNTGVLYAAFGQVAAPAAQVALFPQQTGITSIGTVGMAWHQVEIEKAANLVHWRMDGVEIAVLDTNTLPSLGGGNILFGHSDVNASSSTDPNAPQLLFTLIDNIVVSGCAADLTGDGAVTVFDLLAYLDLWFSASPAAERDGAPDINVFDLLAYLDGWFAGC